MKTSLSLNITLFTQNQSIVLQELLIGFFVLLGDKINQHISVFFSFIYFSGIFSCGSITSKAPNFMDLENGPLEKEYYLSKYKKLFVCVYLQ